MVMVRWQVICHTWSLSYNYTVVLPMFCRGFAEGPGFRLLPDWDTY
jgi:hypothetical protein